MINAAAFAQGDAIGQPAKSNSSAGTRNTGNPFSAAVLSALQAVLRWRRRRLEIAVLNGMEDRLLADIGLTRADVIGLAAGYRRDRVDGR